VPVCLVSLVGIVLLKPIGLKNNLSLLHLKTFNYGLSLFASASDCSSFVLVFMPFGGKIRDGKI
jgi:hypothetical protein